MATSKANKQEKESRLQVVMMLLDQGYYSADIVQVLVTRFGIRKRQAYRYVKEANKVRKVTLTELSGQDIMQDLFLRGNYLYRLGIQTKNGDLALKAITLQSQIVTKLLRYLQNGESERDGFDTTSLSDRLQEILRDLES